MTELIKVKAEGAIVRLTLNNPEQRNPMSNDMIEAFIHCFQSPAVQDAGVVIIAAEG